MLTIDELKLHIKYDRYTGECWRIGFRNKYGDYVPQREPYLITGVTRNDEYGYKRVSINGKRYLVHRLVWFYIEGYWPDTIDHQDGDCSNNIFSNLRNTTRHGNMSNLKIRKGNKTGHIGVSMRNGKYYAQAQRGSEKRISCGYETIEEAVEARQMMSDDLGFHENHGARK